MPIASCSVNLSQDTANWCFAQKGGPWHISGAFPASQKLSSIAINVRQLPSFLTARFQAARWCRNIGTLVRGLARVMLKIQYDIDTMNNSITEVLKRFANKRPPQQPGEALLMVQKRVQST
jgi:hypothetical protein